MLYSFIWDSPSFAQCVNHLALTYSEFTPPAIALFCEKPQLGLVKAQGERSNPAF